MLSNFSRAALEAAEEAASAAASTSSLSRMGGGMREFDVSQSVNCKKIRKLNAAAHNVGLGSETMGDIWHEREHLLDRGSRVRRDSTNGLQRRRRLRKAGSKRCRARDSHEASGGCGRALHKQQTDQLRVDESETAKRTLEIESIRTQKTHITLHLGPFARGTHVLY